MALGRGSGVVGVWDWGSGSGHIRGHGSTTAQEVPGPGLFWHSGPRCAKVGSGTRVAGPWRAREGVGAVCDV